MYDLLRNSTDYKQLNLRIKYYKAKIVQINGQKLRQIQTELRDNMVLPDEQITLYHIIKRNQRRQKQLIKEIQDTDGIIHNNINGIRNTFYREIQHRFLPIKVNRETIDNMCSTMVHTIVETDMKYMDGPITKEELTNAFKSAPKNKSPGEDGITAEFYKWSKDIMINDILQVYNSFFETGKIPK